MKNRVSMHRLLVSSSIDFSIADTGLVNADGC